MAGQEIHTRLQTEIMQELYATISADAAASLVRLALKTGIDELSLLLCLDYITENFTAEQRAKIFRAWEDDKRPRKRPRPADVPSGFMDSPAKNGPVLRQVPPSPDAKGPFDHESPYVKASTPACKRPRLASVPPRFMDSSAKNGPLLEVQLSPYAVDPNVFDAPAKDGGAPSPASTATGTEEQVATDIEMARMVMEMGQASS